MNIFILDNDIKKCAEYHCNAHVVKMITEYNQLLSTAIHVIGIQTQDPVYKKTHVNHPCAVWARLNRSNFQYLIDLNKELLKEYTHRYGKIHAGSRLIHIFESVIDQVPEGKLTRFPICMPESCHVDDDSVLSYRKYYIMEKSHIAKWKNRDMPSWYVLKQI